MEHLESNLLIRLVQRVQDTKARAQLACVCKAWREAVAESWESVELTFGNVDELETRLTWLSEQLHARPWLLHSIEFKCRQQMAPISMDLHLGRFSGLTSLNFLCMEYGLADQKFDPEVHHMWRPYIILSPDALDKLSCTSGSLQKLWLAFSDDVEHTTLEQFSTFTNLRSLHISLCGSIGNRPVSTTVRMSASLTALTKLEAFQLRGAGLVGEERPGVVSEFCRTLTSLLLHGETMSSSEPISSPTLQYLSIVCLHTHRLPVGYCPELLTLIHSARDVTAADLLRLPKLTSLRDTICSPANISQAFVRALQPLSGLQHIQLSQYQLGEGGDLSEMSIFPALQSVKLMIDNDPDLLHLSSALSGNSALHTIELRKSFTATHYQPIAVVQAESMTALKSLTLECHGIIGTLACPSLEHVELIGAGGYIMPVWPDVSGCPRLKTLKLRNMPPVRPPDMFGVLTSLENLQITFAYTARMDNRIVILHYDRREHFDSINDLLEQLPCLPSMHALQIVAIQSNMAVNLGKAHDGGLCHLALACRSLVMLTEDRQGCSVDSPNSLHLLLRGTQDARTTQYLRSKQARVSKDDRFAVVAYKTGQPNALDLDWDEVIEDVYEDAAATGDFRLVF